MGFAVSLMVISVYAFLIEIKPFITGSTTPTTRFNILEKTDIKAGLSPYSNKLLLNNCLEATAGPVGMAQPTSRRKTVLISCQSLAKDITSFMPTHAFAYYIGAFASAELKQYSEFNFQIAASQKTAPNGQWLAQFRVELVEENFEKITSATLSSHKQDLILLAKNASGVRSIATRYVSQPEFRERITELVETLSPKYQKSFVNNVRRAANEISQRRQGLEQ